ncbi:serine hydrolase domain-containing protein [Isoptericola aurantiacus]|uniref:serine hydrolase domain-containing protein n=1 Tax=Isoptericola aurantiacus TaxID=3377839 RepID=UPI00383BCC0E
MTTTRRLPRATPQSQGVDPDALERLVETLDGVDDVHSLMVLRHGHVVAEAWWDPFVPEEPHRMFSVSKSVTATAVGLAVAEGLLTTHDRVLDLLPDDAPPDPGEHLAAMTVRDLLTMTSGHGADTMQFRFDNLHRPGDRWARDILAAPVVHEPGTRFVYNTGATYLLSAILHRLTGERLLDWLTPRLFAPLGISGATWEQCPAGIDVGGYGLAITTEDLATLGQLWLQRGRWGGTQLVPAGWIEEMTSFQVPNGPDESPDWEQGYGYQFWRCRHDAYRADGAFGQFCVVSPAHDAVVVLTSGTTETSRELEAVLDAVTSGMSDGGTAVPQDGAGPFVPDGLAVARPRGSAHVPLADFVRGSSFVLADGAVDPATAEDGVPEPGSPDDHGRELLRWHAVAVQQEGDRIELCWTPGPDQPWHTVVCGTGRWITGSVRLAVGEIGVAGAAAWTAHDTLTARLVWRGTPFTLDVVLTFGGDGEGRHVELAVDQNVSFGPTALLRATGLGA